MARELMLDEFELMTVTDALAEAMDAHPNDKEFEALFDKVCKVLNDENIKP